MIDKNLENRLLGLGFTKASKQLYGVYGGFLITILGSGKKFSTFINFYTNDTKTEITQGDSLSLMFFELSESIKTKLEKFRIIDYSPEPKGLFVHSNSNAETFLEMLDFLIANVKTAGLIGISNCSNCGALFEEKFPKKVLLESKNYLYCDSCAINLIEDTESLRDSKPLEENIKRKTFHRILGSLLGGLIGAFLLFSLYNWLLPVFGKDIEFDIRYLFTALGFGIAFFIHKGYMLRNNFASLFSYYLLPFLTLIFSFVGQYCGTIAYILKENSTKFSQITEYKNLLLMPFRSTAIGKSPSYNTSFYLFFGLTSLLGIISIFILLSNTKTKTQDIEMPKIETLKIQSVTE